jgi:chemotaxis protein histidine kinase CheA
MDDINNDLEKIFEKETLLHLEKLHNHLQMQVIDSKTLHEIYKEYHTMTGSAGIVKHDSIMKFTRELTTFCKNLENQNKSFSNEQIKVLLESIDVIKNLLNDKNSNIDYNKVLEKLTL